MSELPQGWLEVEIGELCNLINGRAFKPQEWDNEGLPIIRIQNLNRPNAAFNYFSGELDSRHLVSPKQLLFAWSGTPGTSFGAHVWHGPQAALNQHIFKIDFDSEHLDKIFFRHAINQKLDQLISSAQGGVGLRHVTKGTFERTQIVLPPLMEQKRIAQKLDALLAQVDTLKAHIDAIPTLLKRFRSSILESAIDGSLTNHWRTLNSKTEWSETVVGELLSAKPRNGYSPKPVDYETNTRSLSLSATTSGKFRSEFSKFIAEPIPAHSHLWLEPGDILIQRANTLEYVGVSAIFVGQKNQFIYPDLMMK